MEESILSVQNLRKIYHTKNEEILAVDNFSFTLHKGEIIAIVGPSGCGKSTILNMIGGLIPKSSGKIEFNEEKNISYMLQEDALFPFRTVYKNCLLGLEVKNINTEENQKYVHSLIKRYGLEEFENSLPSNLSGGMRQRVALIRTIAINPDILLLDEPFSALDYQTRLAVSDDVWKIIKKEKKTTIMITHDIAEAISMADRIIVLTNRPSKVKSIYTIEMKNKQNPINNRKQKEFQYYYDKIWKDIDINV